MKKAGANKGRRFWACSADRDEQCDLFLWEDDNVAEAVSEFGMEESEGEWKRRRREELRKVWDSMSVAELKRETARWQLPPRSERRADALERLDRATWEAANWPRAPCNPSNAGTSAHCHVGMGQLPQEEVLKPGGRFGTE